MSSHGSPSPAPESDVSHSMSVGAGEVRTYRGRTVGELIPQIKAELGPGAIILREREGLTGGIGGFFAQRCVEIDAQASPRVSIYADDLEDLNDDRELDAPAVPAAPAAALPRTAASPPVASAAPPPAPTAPTAPPILATGLASLEAQAFLAAAATPGLAPPQARASVTNVAAPALEEPSFAVHLDQAEIVEPQPQPQPEPNSQAQPALQPVPEPQAEPEPAPAGPGFIAFDDLAGDPLGTEPVAVQSAAVAAEVAEPAVAEPAAAVAAPLEIPVPVAIDPPPAVAQTPAPFRSSSAATPVPAAAAPPMTVRRRRGGVAERVIRAAQAARVAASELQAPVDPHASTTTPSAILPSPASAATPSATLPSPASATVSSPTPVAPVTRGPAPAPEPALGDEPLPLPTPATATANPATPAVTETLQRRLLDAGLSRARAHELIGAALDITELDEDLEDAIREELTSALAAPSPLPLSGGAIAVVGAGGAGKTRCVAALAVACARSTSLPVSVARLGTPERDTELAELLIGENVDVIPMMRTRATVRAVSSARTRGLVILDTPAASPADASIEVLGDALAQLELDGIYLAVPATFTARAAAKLTESLAPLGLDGLMATHVDEADQLGVVAELSIQTGLPLSHTHSGITVSTAITPMNPRQLTEVLLP